MPKSKIETIKVWVCVDLKGTYFHEIFKTKNEAEAFRRGTAHLEDGKFGIFKGEVKVEIRRRG